MVDAVLQDLQSGIRRLRRAPALAALVVLSLALGIGANTALFGIARSMLFEPVPYQQPDRVVFLNLHFGDAPTRFSESQVALVQQRSQSLERVEAVSHEPVNWRRGDSTIRLLSAAVTPGLLSRMTVSLLTGRGFTAADGAHGTEPVAIISEGLWERELGRAPDVVGKTLTLEDVRRTVIGVIRPPASWPADVDAWTPRRLETGGDWSPAVVGWLRPGVSMAEARADLQRLSPELTSDRFAAAEIRLSRPGEQLGVNRFDRMMIIFWGASAFLLAIVCSNLANALLARNLAGQREIAIRAALGASRVRIVRMLLAEVLLLAAAGGAGGALVAMWGTSALLALRPISLSLVYPQEVPLDAAAVAYSLVLSIITGLAIGLLPAWRSARVAPLQGIVRDDPHARGAAPARWLFGSAVTAQSALALILLIGACLLFSSYLRLMRVDPGFDPQNLVRLGLELDPAAHASEPARREFFEQLAVRVSGLDGVVDVAVATDAPPHSTVMGSVIEVNGRGSESLPTVEASWVHVTPNYFRMLRIPLIAGRFLSDHDGQDGGVVVSESFARKYWPQASSVGRRFRLRRQAGWGQWMTVVGVAGDVSGRGLRDQTDEIYLAFTASRAVRGSIVSRVDRDPADLFQALKEQVWALDPDLPIGSIETVTEGLSQSVDEQPFYATLLGTFALIALLLAGVGVYGVTSYAASQRQREIGIRLALGAQGSQVVRLVVLQGVIPAVAGILIGLAGAAAMSRVMRSLVHEVSVTDPAIYIGTALTLAVISVAATWLPARRAGRVDPMAVLRTD